MFGLFGDSRSTGEELSDFISAQHFPDFFESLRYDMAFSEQSLNFSQFFEIRVYLLKELQDRARRTFLDGNVDRYSCKISLSCPVSIHKAVILVDSQTFVTLCRTLDHTHTNMGFDSLRRHREVVFTEFWHSKETLSVPFCGVKIFPEYPEISTNRSDLCQ
jgi:hypothetical protein